MSLVEESTPPRIRMAHLAIVGSHSVNGVSEIHTRLIRTTLAPDFAELWPDRFNNKTNGVTQRRWLLGANPALADLIRTTIGDGWITRLEELRALERHAQDAAFQAEVAGIKRANKERLARLIRSHSRVRANPDSLFDVHIKRIHAYKRQLLNVMHIVDEYLSLIEDGRTPRVPRTYVFSGKAAPGYWLAKEIIKLIHNVARVINGDARAKDWIAVAFVPDYRVSVAEQIIPSADLSEQISTAGYEASGTGNMKLALNGAVTIGTLDGSNIEILEAVGRDNMFIFGMTADRVAALRQQRSYRPRDHYDRDARVKRVTDAFASPLFCPEEPGLFAWITRSLLDPGDEHVHLGDLPDYLDAHANVAEAFADPARWSRMSILNIARIGRFSIDRTAAEYARDIWHVERVSAANDQ
jgi:starch phosphorylase